MRAEIEYCMSAIPCHHCHDSALSQEILSVTVGGRNIAENCALSVTKALEFMRDLQLTEMQHIIGDRVIEGNSGPIWLFQTRWFGISNAVTCLGNAVRRRKPANSFCHTNWFFSHGCTVYFGRTVLVCISVIMTNCLIHSSSCAMFGNTLIVVEHDEDTMYAADHIVDIGPGAGVHGGEIIFQGTVEDMCKAERSITGAYLSGRRFIPIPEIRRKGSGKWLSVYGAAVHNLKHTDFSIRLEH